MEFVYDPDKNQQNLAKHGVALDEAANLEWDTLWAAEDQRWIISLRKANNREMRRYAGIYDSS